jgi:hypothetical protein
MAFFERYHDELKKCCIASLKLKVLSTKIENESDDEEITDVAKNILIEPDSAEYSDDSSDGEEKIINSVVCHKRS